MRVLSVAELKKCFNGCRWTCVNAVIAGVESAAELALELKRAIGGEAYVNGRDIHIITKKCYIVLTVERAEGGIAIKNALGWSADGHAPWEP